MDNVTLAEWVERIRDHSGMEDSDIIQAGEHGADAGWPGFSYYTDTSTFVEKYRSDIMDRVAADADDYGYANTLAFMGSWGCADGMDDATGIDNGLAWCMLETIGREMEDSPDYPRDEDEDEDEDD